ncbi:hypothetical protein C8J57DRAFT_1543417 [Mycena rebaudengoi]|nr:hypothetical protein C8J57DRAFT_1543417 [Mycena rebaudengoi]
MCAAEEHTEQQPPIQRSDTTRSISTTEVLSQGDAATHADLDIHHGSISAPDTGPNANPAPAPPPRGLSAARAFLSDVALRDPVPSDQNIDGKLRFAPFNAKSMRSPRASHSIYACARTIHTHLREALTVRPCNFHSIPPLPQTHRCHESGHRRRPAVEVPYGFLVDKAGIVRYTRDPSRISKCQDEAPNLEWDNAGFRIEWDYHGSSVEIENLADKAYLHLTELLNMDIFAIQRDFASVRKMSVHAS